ncbi:MAG: DinB family protein [Chloroflexota bacterium]
MPNKIHTRHITLMQKTCDTLGHVLDSVSQEEATTYRDTPSANGQPGWTILEVVCHLRDFDGFFQDRAHMMLTFVCPQLPAYDHEELAIERAYNKQTLTQAYAELCASRRHFIEFFQSLDVNDWNHTGIHPERGHFTMLDAVMQVGLHDVDHLEQITRILRLGRQ